MLLSCKPDFVYNLGSPGSNGATCAVGPAGPRENGTDVSPGANTDPDAKVTPCINGATGATGAQGPAGHTGFPDPAGANGLNGATGATGAVRARPAGMC